MKSNYKRYKGWCDRCDAEIVEKGRVCSNCGYKEKHAKEARKKYRYKGDE